MKFYGILICSFIFLNTADLCRFKTKYEVKITVTYTQSYCGGARPSDDMMQELNTPKPLSGKKLFVKKGKENSANATIIKEVVTDDEGKINLKLEPGFYCVVDENKKDRKKIDEWIKLYEKETTYYEAINKACLEKWFKSADLVIEVQKSGNNFTINYHEPCSWHAIPCANYKGPYPP